MKMDVFAAKVCAAVKKEIGSGYNVSVNEVRKNNGVVLHGLTIREQNQNISPTIYLEAYETDMPLNAIVKDVIAVYRRHAPSEPIDLDFLRSFEAMKDRICFRLIQKAGNEDLLKDVPHTEFLDLAVCYYYAYHKDGIGDGSILVNNTHMQMWDTTAEELHSLAEHNTPLIFPRVCKTMREFVAESMGDAIEPSGNTFLDDVPFKVLSNEDRTHGASCILYPGVLEGLAQRAQSSLYVIPSSVHEALLLADPGGDGLAGTIRETIMEVNRTQIAPEEVLSDSLYYYDLSVKRLKIA